MPSPPGDVVADFGRYLYLQKLQHTLCERHPELAERVQLENTRGSLLLKVMVTGGRAICLGHLRLRHAIVWAVVNPVLNSEPSLWPLDTPDRVLVDVLYAHVSAHLAGEPVPSPWRWHESEPSAMTELADLLDAQGVQVDRVAAGNGYFPHGPRHDLKLDVIGTRGGSLLEATFSEAVVRVSLKPTLGWLLDLHTPHWGSWGRIALARLLRRTESPIPGISQANVSVEEIAELLSGGPDMWEATAPWHPPQNSGRAVELSEAPHRASARHLGLLAPHEATTAVLRQLTTMGFSDLVEGAGNIPIASDVFHLEWHTNSKKMSTSTIQRLNGVAAVAGERGPKRLMVITSAGLTRPAEDFADKAKAFVFRLEGVTGRLTALNSLADEAMLPVSSPGNRELEPW